MGPKVKQVLTPDRLQTYKKKSATYFQSVLAISSEKLQNWLRSKNNACAGWVVCQHSIILEMSDLVIF